MKKLLFSFLVGLSIAVLCISCGKSTKSCTAESILEISQEYSVAISAYGASQTSENCEAYKDVLEKYIDIIDGCPNVDQEDIVELRLELNEIEC